MESSAEAAATDPSAPTFSQVVFTDIPHLYPPSTDITCCYTLTAAFQPHSRDWVGIFKVGWSTTKDYNTFVWVEPCVDAAEEKSVTRQAVFQDYYLPKDETEFYQFCYVDSGGQVRGASTPFCFRTTAEGRSMESNPDDDLLVITTQEQVEQSVHEKAELRKELSQQMEENESLKGALRRSREEAAGSKEQNEREKSELVKEMDQIKEEREKLELQLKETDGLKETLSQMKKQMEQQDRNAAEQKAASWDAASRQTETLAQEKYERAVMKINLLKEEREELRGRVDAQSEEIATLNSKTREQERELFKMRDGVQLLQVDLQSSEKTKARLSEELQRLQSLVEDARRENQELSRKLTQQGTDDDQRGQRLACQLQDAQAKLAAAREESRSNQKAAERLEGELLEVREQLDALVLAHEEARRTSGEQELLLGEAREAVADKDAVIEEKERTIWLMSREREELAEENRNLIAELEMCRLKADFQAASPGGSALAQPETSSADAAAASFEQEWKAVPLHETVGGAADTEEQPLVCRHCQERFPLITRVELEEHERSHRVCPFCTLICDSMEQAVFEDHVYGHEL